MQTEYIFSLLINIIEQIETDYGWIEEKEELLG